MEKNDDCCNDGKCKCDEEMTTEDLVENNNVILNTLIDLLVEKKVISEEDLREKLAALETEIEKPVDAKEVIEEDLKDDIDEDLLEDEDEESEVEE